MADTITVTIGKHTLRGVKVGGKWRFTCKRWPDLAKEFTGADSACPAIEEFTRREVKISQVIKTLADDRNFKEFTGLGDEPTTDDAPNKKE